MNNQRIIHEADRKSLKIRTVYINDEGFSHMDIYNTLTKDILRDDIIGLIKTNGTWQILNFEHDYDYGQAGCVCPLIKERKKKKKCVVSLL